jgi:hypothetical protein
MKAFPAEFEALLSRAGKRLLAGQHPAAGALGREGFFAGAGLLEARHLAACTRLLAATFVPEVLNVVERPLPPETSSTKSYEDSLPKVGRMSSTLFDGPLAYVASRLSRDVGLTRMMESDSFHRFAEVLAGEPLARLRALQVLNNAPGDYAGPHTDHHPEDDVGKHGYVDVHLTFCSPGVKEQFIVYQRAQHLSAMAPIGKSGTITAYRLPLWHYTTPLQARRPEDRRWLVLGTFNLTSSEARARSSAPASAPPPSS